MVPLSADYHSGYDWNLLYALCYQELVKKIESVVKYDSEDEKGETACKDTKINPCSVYAINPVAIGR